MVPTRAFLKSILDDRRGATAVEYGLILSLIVLVMVGAFNQLANETNGMWGRVSNTVTAVMGR